MYYRYLKPGSRPRTSVADNTGCVVVQWQITLDVADNALILQHGRGRHPSFLRDECILKLISYTSMERK